MLGSCQNPQAATGPHQAVLALPPTEAVCLGTGLERSSAKDDIPGGAAGKISQAAANSKAAQGR